MRMNFRRRYNFLFSSQTRVIYLTVICAVLTSLLSSRLDSQAQSSCLAYYQCTDLQAVSPNKVQGPIKYWFDNDHIDSFLTPEAANDFRERITAAANDWAARTGVTISQAASGPVRIRVSGVSAYRFGNGIVEPDQIHPGGIVMTFSTEWPDWTAAGKDRLASHEWGHVLGIRDVAENGCPFVETIMRKFSGDSAIFDSQLKGTAILPKPGRPVLCDWCNAKDKQAGVMLGTSCPAPTPEYAPEPCAQPEFNGGGATSCECDPNHPDCVSPVLVDILGDGFELTDASGGVNFDIKKTGSPLRLAWTKQNSDDAWLSLDRNGNGTIDDGGELFGNFTSQPSSGEPNGFIALAEFDKTQNGGNGDGRISQSDGMFFSLRLWRDINHNGISEAEELHTLTELGLTTLDLKFKEANRTDQQGNWFRYRAKVDGNHGSNVDRWAWDVFLRSAP